jgi:S1-C subfamily serine protease
VVEEAWELTNAKALTEKLYKEQMIKVEARVWVFFGHKKDFAQIIYVSPKFDLAVLKIDRAFDVALNLSSEFRGARGSDVLAVGYPGMVTLPTSDASLIDFLFRQLKNDKGEMEDVSLFFKESDFAYTLTKGSISKINQEQDGIRWIEHEALIAHGNSGGPLVRPDGLVLGINTQLINEEDSKAQISNALEISQLREEIDGCARDVTWK